MRRTVPEFANGLLICSKPKGETVAIRSRCVREGQRLARFPIAQKSAHVLLQNSRIPSIHDHQKISLAMECRSHRISEMRRFCTEFGVLRSLPLIVAFTVAFSHCGCRAIRKIGDDGQSIAARRLSREGIKAMHDGKWTEAETLFSNALEISKADDRAHRGLAEAMWNRDETDTAIVHMENAVRLSGSDPKLVQRLGRMYLEQGRLAEATQQCEIALSAERNSADIWALRGDCLSRTGKNEQALAAYHRALALQPDFQSVQIEAAEIYRKQGRFDRLLATLDQMESSKEEEAISPRVDLLRGIAMRELGQHDEARRHFMIASQKNKDDAEPLLHLATVELHQSNSQAAKAAVERAYQLNPQLVQQTGWQKMIEPESPLMKTASARISDKAETIPQNSP